MFRPGFIVLMITLFSGTSIFAQTDFTEVDSTTYQQYLNQQWKPLIQYGRKASKSGLDYYYLNMRIGIAYYNKLQYYKAANYFKKALKNDSNSDGAKEYLFWADLLGGNEKEADDTYATLSDSVQQRLKYKIKRPFESIFLEGGVKISTLQNIAKNVGYAQLGLNHKFTSSFSIYHAYTFQAQKQVWGHFYQHQYYFAPSVKFKKNLTLNIGFHYSHYSGVIEFTDNPPVEHSPPPPMMGPFLEKITTRHIIKNGTYKEDLLLSQVSLSKTIKGFTISPHAGLFLNFQKPDFIDSHHDTTVNINHIAPGVNDTTVDIRVGDSIANSKDIRYEGLIGVALSYNFGRIAIGADVTAIFNQKVKTAIVTPWVRAVLAKRFAVKAMYMYKGAYPLALFDGSQLYNSLDKIKYKASITGEIFPTKKLTLYLTYQFEGITDSFSSQDYKLHTLLIGLNLKL